MLYDLTAPSPPRLVSLPCLAAESLESPTTRIFMHEDSCPVGRWLTGDIMNILVRCGRSEQPGSSVSLPGSRPGMPLCLSACICLSLCLSACICLSVSLSACICLSLCLSACICVYLCLLVSVCLSLCLSACICLSVSLSVCLYLSVCLSVFLLVSVSLYLCLSACIWMSFCLLESVCLCPLVSVYLSYCLSVCLSVCFSCCPVFLSFSLCPPFHSCQDRSCLNGEDMTSSTQDLREFTSYWECWEGTY